MSVSTKTSKGLYAENKWSTAIDKAQDVIDISILTETHLEGSFTYLRKVVLFLELECPKRLLSACRQSLYVSI